MKQEDNYHIMTEEEYNKWLEDMGEILKELALPKKMLFTYEEYLEHRREMPSDFWARLLKY